MSDTPWLSIIGIHEDGIAPVSAQAKQRLAEAEIILAPPRHLSHLHSNYHHPDAQIIPWPVPYQEGVEMLQQFRGRKVAVLASGDPFHFGAATSLTASLSDSEWCCFPALSCFSLMATALGWPQEKTLQFGLHARPVEMLQAALHPSARLFILLRDADGLRDLGVFLCEQGYHHSICHIFSEMKSEMNTPTTLSAWQLETASAQAPVCCAVELAGSSSGLPLSSGKPDECFAHHGQITKQPVRAISLASLAPRPGEHLLDIGAGSGSVSVEWMLTHPTMRATAIEMNPERINLITENAARFGCTALKIIHGDIHQMLEEIPSADAIFIGGGASDRLIEAVWAQMKPHNRLVINAVTAESEALILRYYQRYGGNVIKIDLSDLTALGSKHGWKARYPITHWCVHKPE